MERWMAALRLIGLGWYIGSCIVLGVVGGLWLDNKFNTKPILVVVCLVLGVVVAFYGTYQMILPLIRNKRNKEDD